VNTPENAADLIIRTLEAGRRALAQEEAKS